MNLNYNPWKIKFSSSSSSSSSLSLSLLSPFSLSPTLSLSLSFSPPSLLLPPSPPLSVHTLKIEYNVSLSVTPTRLKELLNMVYHRGQSGDSSASILMIYLCVYHQILQHVICSRMTQHFIQQEKRRANSKDATASS